MTKFIGRIKLPWSEATMCMSTNASVLALQQEGLAIIPGMKTALASENCWIPSIHPSPLHKELRFLCEWFGFLVFVFACVSICKYIYILMASPPFVKVSVSPSLQGRWGLSLISRCNRNTLNFRVVNEKVGVIKPASRDSWEKPAD